MKNIIFAKMGFFNSFIFGVLLFPAILAGFLLSVPSASAYSKVVTQSSGQACDYKVNVSGERVFGQSFVATSTNLDSASLRLSSQSGTGEVLEIKICEGNFSTAYTYSDAAVDWNCDHPGQRSIFVFKPSSLNIAAGPNPSWVDIDFPYPVAVVDGGSYFFLFKTFNTLVCIQNSQYSDRYPFGEARLAGTNIKDVAFSLYYAPETIDWSLAVPEKATPPVKAENYVSGSSLKLNWTTPNLYQESDAIPTYEVEYWKRVYGCEIDYSPLATKRSSGPYSAAPGQTQEAVIEGLDRNTTYCLSVSTSNGYNRSPKSDIAEVSTEDIDYTEEIDQDIDLCELGYNMNQTMLYGQGLVTNQDNISSISLKMKNIGAAPGQAYELRLCRGTMTASSQTQPDADWACDQDGQAFLSSATSNQTMPSGSPEWVSFRFESSVSVTPGEPLFFIFKGQGLSVCGQKNGDLYSKGEARSAYNANDFAFKTFYSPYGIVTGNKIKVAVVLTETKDVKHLSTPITAQPCKLIPEKTYQNGHDREYYEDLLYCVKDYHCENSFGKMNEQGECVGGLVDLEFEFYGEGNWQYLDKNTTDYRDENKEERKEFKFLNDLEENISYDGGADILFFVGPGDSFKFKGYFETLARGDYRVLFAENDGVYFAAHEIAHLLGFFFTPEDSPTLVPDLYNMGEAQGWDVMHYASLATVGNPMLMSSYTKEFLQWFNYDIYPKSDFGDYWIEYLEEKGKGDKVFRYNLENSNGEDVQEYYVIEARDGGSKIWEESMPENEVVVLYFVDENGSDEYGVTDKGFIINEFRTVSVPGRSGSKSDSINDGVLNPVFNETFRDFDKLIKITAKNREKKGDAGGINVKIEEMTSSNPFDGFWGLVLNDNTGITRKGSYASFNGAGYLSEKELDEISRGRAVSMIPLDLKILFLFLLFLVIFIVISKKQEKSFALKPIKNLLAFISFILAILFTFLSLWIVVTSISYSNSRFFDPNWLFHVSDERDFSSYQTEALRDSVARKEAMTMIPFASIVFLLDIVFAVLLVFFVKKLRIGILGKRVMKVLLCISVASLSSLFFVLVFLIISLSISHNNFDNLKYFKYINAFAPSVEKGIVPDTDLHLYCDDGRHVGVNYETGEYEIDISEAETIGDGVNSREWIFVPAEYRDICHFVVSSKDTQKFIDENPKEADEIGLDNLKNKYEVYARYMNPDGGVDTSETVTGELNPNQMIEYVAEMNDGLITTPVGEPFDSLAPTTATSIFGQLGDYGYYTSPVEVELIGNDGEGGSGILKTEYNLDGGEAWLEYADKIVLSVDGVHTLAYRSTDKAGNREDVKEVKIKIDRTAPDITMILPQDGQEIGHDAKLNVGYLAERVK
jgi:uncharacterized protein YebE (UPF0316 family)